MKGTIFEGSSTSLKLWFSAIYLMASTRCGISAKQLERSVGVSYPTALRMFRQIRSLVSQEGDEWEQWGGTVEADEAYIGGRGKWRHDQGKQRTGRPQPGTSRNCGQRHHRASRRSSPIRASARAKGAPRQKCSPQPKAT